MYCAHFYNFQKSPSNKEIQNFSSRKIFLCTVHTFIIFKKSSLNNEIQNFISVKNYVVYDTLLYFSKNHPLIRKFNFSINPDQSTSINLINPDQSGSHLILDN